MKRRHILKTLGAGCIGVSITPKIWGETSKPYLLGTDDALKDYINKIKNFDDPHKDDVQIGINSYAVFESTVMRLRRLQRLVGHGNFGILNFKDALAYARNYPSVGKFTKPELQFMETIFYEDSQHYGYLGPKPLKEITDQIIKKDVIKIPRSGNYLYKDRSAEIFDAIKNELGDDVLLTSGIRSVMKQFLLFLNKVHKSDGNLSLASRSLAPPGYSFHGNGDFDVGQTGYGKLNFTAHFTETDVYKRLTEMGYLKLRYPEDNRLGVRYEPWHIKINTDVELADEL